MQSSDTRPRWLLPAVAVGTVLVVAVLALTQPWLLFVDTVADEQLPTVDAMPTATPEPTGAVVLASGSFISRDHTTSGEVAIVHLEDGRRVLTIEGLATDNGPDLYVYLDDDPADAPEGEFDDGIDLGRLRANIGDLVYELPDDVDLDDVASVGIWCDRFSSLFGAADLTSS